MRSKSKFRYVNHNLFGIMKPARKQVPMSALGQKQTSRLYSITSSAESGAEA